MNEDKYAVVDLTKSHKGFTFNIVILYAIILLFFVLIVIPTAIMNKPEKQLEYYVAQEIQTDLPEEVRNYDECVFELKEIKEQRKVLDEGADWKIYDVKFRCVDEESETITVKEYVAFVYYKFVVGKYFRNGYYAILDCDLAKVN